VAALGLIALQLFVVGHMALERHTVSTTGAVVELHASLDLHAHEDRSLCERAAADDGAWPDDACQATPESLQLDASRAPVSAVRSLGSTLVATSSSRRPGPPVWLLAPKASPPRAQA